MEEQNKYYNQINKSSSDDLDGFKDVEHVSYENPYEVYLITQLKIVESLPPVIEEHIHKLNVGEDIDIVLELFELDVFHIKKDIYSNLLNGKSSRPYTDERISEY